MRLPPSGTRRNGGGVLAFNEFRFGTVVLKPAPWGVVPRGEWTDHEDRLSAEWLQRQGMMVPVEVAGQAVQTAARDHPFHPVKVYLQTLKWDGVERLERWLSAYLGADDTEYTRAVGARWLISAVASNFSSSCEGRLLLDFGSSAGHPKIDRATHHRLRVLHRRENPAYPAALEASKEEGVLPGRVRLRQCKYLNNVVEQDHHTVKKRTWLAKGYSSFLTAWRTLQGIEAVNMIRKGRAK